MFGTRDYVQTTENTFTNIETISFILLLLLLVFFCPKVVMAADFMFQPRVCKYVCIYFFILYICTYIYRYCGMYVVVKKNLC